MYIYTYIIIYIYIYICITGEGETLYYMRKFTRLAETRLAQDTLSYLLDMLNYLKLV